MKKLFIGIFLLIVLSYSVIAACNTPTNNNLTDITTATICTGTYYNLSLRPSANNMILDTNGSTIRANQTSSSYRPINQAYNGRSNVTIKNGVVNGAATGIGIYRGTGNGVYITNMTAYNFTDNIEIDMPSTAYTTIINNSNISYARGCLANIMVYGTSGLIIENTNINDGLNISSCSVGTHGIYFSQQSAKVVQNIYINNCSISRNYGEGIHFNGVSAINYNNVTIQNSNFIANRAYGLDIQGVANSTIKNNYIANHSNFGLGFGTGDFNLPTKNTIILNNTFYNNTNADIITPKNNLSLTITDNISIINNTFSNYFDNSDTVNVRIYHATQVYFEGDVFPTFKYAYANSGSTTCTNSTILTNYTGRITFTDVNCTIGFINGNNQYPYNDIYNVSYDFNTYNITLIYNQTISIGDFNCDKHYKDNNQEYTCNTTGCYLPNSNCTVWSG